MVLTLTKKKDLCCLKTNNQGCQIICLNVVSRYNFLYLKKLFIKSFSRQDKINCSIVALRIMELSLELSDIFLKSKVCVKTLMVFSNKLQLKLFKELRSAVFINKLGTVKKKIYWDLFIIPTATKQIYRILETMLEFLLS